MGVDPEGLRGYVPEDVAGCIAVEDPFRWVEVVPTVYATEDPRGSTTIIRLSNETGKNWILEVDYQRILDYIYVSSGTGFALPERPYQEQIDDWKHGYMWGRFKLAPNCGTTVKRTAGFDEYGHFFWVKYYARLYELAPDPNKALIELELGEWVSGALKRFQTDSTFRDGIINTIATKISGWRLTHYSFKENKFSLALERTGSPAIIITAGLIVKLLVVFGILVIVWKVLDVYEKKIDYEAEANRQATFNSLKEELIAEGYTTEEAITIASGAVDTMKVQQEQYQDKLQLIKYAKYGAIGLGTLMALSLVRDIVKR